jgi:predicted phage gp36 major capsid-like protein
MPDDEQDDEQQFDIGNQDHFDNAPEEWHDHLTAAILHKAGMGPHPGKYKGRQPQPPSDDAITEGDLQRVREEGLERHLANREAHASKMKAAQTGGSLAPSEMEKTAATQAGAISQQAGAAGDVQAAQAQGAQAPIAPPPAAPGGPVGQTQPYAAQRGETPPGVPEKGSGPRSQQAPEEEAPEAPEGEE